MAKAIGQRSASGITDQAQAMQLAQGFATMYGEDYVVLRYSSPSVEFDIEPAQPTDCPLTTPHVIARVTPPND